MGASAVQIFGVRRASSSSLDWVPAVSLGLVLAALVVGYFLLLNGPVGAWAGDWLLTWSSSTGIPPSVLKVAGVGPLATVVSVCVVVWEHRVHPRADH